MADPQAKVLISHPAIDGVAEMTRLQFDEVYKPKGWEIVTKGDPKHDLLPDASHLADAFDHRESLRLAAEAKAAESAPDGPVDTAPVDLARGGRVAPPAPVAPDAGKAGN